MRAIDYSVPMPASRFLPSGLVQGFAKCRYTDTDHLIGWFWTPDTEIQDWRLVPGESLIFPHNSPVVHL